MTQEEAVETGGGPRLTPTTHRGYSVGGHTNYHYGTPQVVSVVEYYADEGAAAACQHRTNGGATAFQAAPPQEYYQGQQDPCPNSGAVAAPPTSTPQEWYGNSQWAISPPVTPRDHYADGWEHYRRNGRTAAATSPMPVIPKELPDVSHPAPQVSDSHALYMDLGDVPPPVHPEPHNYHPPPPDLPRHVTCTPPRLSRCTSAHQLHDGLHQRRGRSASRSRTDRFGQATGPRSRRSQSAALSTTSHTSTRLDLAEEKFNERMRKHEIEWERAVRMKEKKEQREREEAARHAYNLQKEQQAQWRRQGQLATRTQLRRYQNNERLQTALHRNEEQMRQRADELQRREQERQRQQMERREQELKEGERKQMEMMERDQWRNAVYLRNIMLDDSKRQITQGQLEARKHHVTSKAERLEQVRQQKRYENEIKAWRSAVARRQQAEENERLRLEVKQREAERAQVQEEIARLGRSIVADRMELMGALDRLHCRPQYRPIYD
mmetsp:Transcript_94137/g.162810  ORF Transcript_94137/g.162810 Transcript_94137/m.162810 type:complete len:495 (-) Transcript_94137:297-1781(-)